MPEIPKFLPHIEKPKLPSLKEGLHKLNQAKGKLLLIGLLGLTNLAIGADYLATKNRLSAVERNQQADEYLIGDLIKSDVSSLGLACLSAGKIMELEGRPDALTEEDCAGIQQEEAQYWMKEIISGQQK